MELKECLMHDQQDKKRAYENYRHTAELSTGGGCEFSKGGGGRKDSVR